jgi:hypothetical protein
MKNKFLISIVSLIAVLLNACKTDVDIIAPYVEKAVVYGLLDISQPIQYIKINKVFLGKGDANAMAQIADSSNFNPDDMNVIIEKYNGNSFLGTITLFDTIIPNANNGSFSKSNNIIYATKEPLTENLTYKLKIENKKTGYKAEASANVIAKIRFNGGGTAFAFVSNDNKYAPKTSIKWFGSKNAKIYELTFRLNYKEFKNGNDTVYKHVDWTLSPQYASNIDFEGELVKTLNGEEFFQFLSSQKSVYFGDNSFRRIPHTGQIYVTAAGEDYQIYKDLNAPYSSNFQEKPIYTNIKNGLGVYSARITTFGSPLPFNGNTINEFVNGKYTNTFGFIKP